MRAFKKTLPSDLDQVKGALDDALAYIRKNTSNISKEDEHDFRLVLWELLVNAAIHGNGLDTGKKVRLRIECERGACFVTVEDEGEGFDYQALLDDYLRQTPEEALESEHGRGVRIAVGLMDQFAFNGKGNKVTCTKHVTLKGSAQ